MSIFQALAGQRILELSGSLAVSFCGKYLAEIGAAVVKVEPPDSGDAARRLHPLALEGRSPDPESSPLHLYLNAGKKSVALNWKGESGRETLRRLVAASQVVLHSYGPPELEELGIGFEQLESWNPQLVVASLTPFGLSGPYAAWRASEGVLFATGGAMHLTGDPHREPLKPYGFPAHYHLGMNGANAVLAALLARERLGRGQRVEVAAMECGVNLLENAVALASIGDESRGRHGNRYYTTGPVPDAYPCADGYVIPATFTEPQWQAFCLLFGHPELVADPGLATWPQRVARGDELGALIAEWTAPRTRAEIFHAAQELRIPLAMVLTPQEVLRNEQHAARDAFQWVEQVSGRRLPLPRLPFIVNGERSRCHRAPTLGEHNGELAQLTTVGAPEPTAPSAATTASPQETAEGPLSGVRIVDLTQAWAGPYGTTMLADLGAQVIKIESATRPDIMRLLGSEAGEQWSEDAFERGAWFHYLNRNKLSFSLELDTAEGKDLFKELVAHSDVVIENFSARVMNNLGLGYPVLRSVNPVLIMVGMPSFGATGPYRDYVCYGEALEGMGGLPWLTGYRDGKPLRIGVAIADAFGSFHMVFGVLAALVTRRRTGQGAFLDISQFESLNRLLGETYIAQELGFSLEQWGNRDPAMAPHGCYPCRGQDAWVVIGLPGDAEWRALCQLMGRQDLADDPRLRALAGRRAAHDQLDEAIAAWTVGHTKHDVMARCQEAGIPAGAVLRPAEFLTDPHLAQRRFFVEVQHPLTGQEVIQGVNYRLSGTPARVRCPAPLFGQHDEFVLREILGKTDAEIVALREHRVVGGQPRISLGTL